ncbi:MAG: tetratricopeptide repeat protein [Phycisphaeraceae bacterium]|nr:tetratricopeptide repeat protein [Phycisphaeraceae bacterium]
MNQLTKRIGCGGLVVMLALVTGCQTQQKAADEPSAQARAQVKQADQYLAKGLLDSALAAFGIALEENPEMVEAHMGMGDIYRARDNYGLAENAYKRAADLDPSNFDAHYYLGLMRQLAGKVQEAITAYLQALAIKPDSLEANRDLASAYLQSQATYQALPYALRATELNKEDQNAWYTLATTYSLLGQYANAVDAYRQAAELGELAEPVMLGLADAHLKLGNYQRAINVLQVYMKKSTTPNALAYERMGYALFKLRRFDEALAQYQAALVIDENSVASLNGAGACLMTQYIQGGRDDQAVRDEAVKLWRKSVDLNPDQSKILDLLARYSRL